MSPAPPDGLPLTSISSSQSSSRLSPSWKGYWVNRGSRSMSSGWKMGVCWDQSRSIRPHAPSISYSLGSGLRPGGISGSPWHSQNKLWGSTMSGLTREVGTTEYEGLSSIRSRLFFHLGNHFLVLLSVHLPRLVHGKRFPSSR